MSSGRPPLDRILGRELDGEALLGKGGVCRVVRRSIVIPTPQRRDIVVVVVDCRRGVTGRRSTSQPRTQENRLASCIGGIGSFGNGDPSGEQFREDGISCISRRRRGTDITFILVASLLGDFPPAPFGR